MTTPTPVTTSTPTTDISRLTASLLAMCTLVSGHCRETSRNCWAVCGKSQTEWYLRFILAHTSLWDVFCPGALCLKLSGSFCFQGKVGYFKNWDTLQQLYRDVYDDEYIDSGTVDCWYREFSLWMNSTIDPTVTAQLTGKYISGIWVRFRKAKTQFHTKQPVDILTLENFCRWFPVQWKQLLQRVKHLPQLSWKEIQTGSGVYRQHPNWSPGSLSTLGLPFWNSGFWQYDGQFALAVALEKCSMAIVVIACGWYLLLAEIFTDQ